MAFNRLAIWAFNTPLYKKVFKYFYPLVTRLLGEDEVLFINWAYEEDPPMALQLDEVDEPNRTNINLYHRTATQVDLRGKRVLEVSCGHGGGASYLTRTLRPASYTGLDLNPRGIAFCQKRHNLPGLNFTQGDAENLPFADQSFDVVLNVEASHCYPHFPRFLDEVVRVLRPQGHFLYADIRSSVSVPKWEADLAASPMQQLSQKIINEQVLRGLSNNSPRSTGLVNRHLPTVLRRVGREFAAVQGSRAYRYLQKGDISYRMYCFTKK